MDGFFPMADDRHGEIFWHCPDPRAIFPLANLIPSRKERQSFRKYNFSFSIDTKFEEVIYHCAEREDTWINDEIINTYVELHYNGFAHSVETYSSGKLVGGLYGVSVNGAFFGESMFNTVPNASKSAFFYLAEHLRNRGFLLLDSQYINPFTRQLGAIEISKNMYMFLLRKALELDCKFI
ncbi:MAG: leucyl/phenylalanyl-tRNA--protein transferase [Candidatus Kapabacteria bacterium]|nr:leucyl/phenylalanyl-tRNA--protein transferase [Ignavibacteriota bacterium]MCW5884107.1 leucyl/phenylalanyl-tRNA--protein transferase [Candidatus Kapabacteria bacterium]